MDYEQKNLADKPEIKPSFQGKNHHGSVRITEHAMQRLEERVVSFDGFRSWQHLVKTARYEGRTEQNMTAEEYAWCKTHLHKLNRSAQIRLLNGYMFLFMGNKGHARTLVTVLEVA